MSDFLGSLAGGAIGAIGSIIGGNQAANSAKDVNRQSIAFAKQSAQNKYQWTVNDMRAAGLNPMLMMSHGATGANQPGLHNPGTTTQAAYTGAGQNLAAGINSAAAAKNAETQAAVGHANVAIASEQVLNLAATRNLTYEQTFKVNQEITNLVEQLNLTREQSALVFQQARHSAAQARSVQLNNDQLEIFNRFIKQHEGSFIARELNMPSLIRTIMPGLEDTLKQLNNWRNK